MEKSIAFFREHLIGEEKSTATIEKYCRDVRRFLVFLGKQTLSKSSVMAYKKALVEGYAPASANSMLVAVNCYLCFIGRPDCCVRLPKIQRQLFCSAERELTAPEYRRLMAVAGERMRLILQTVCETGIRVSELRYITVEAVANKPFRDNNRMLVEGLNPKTIVELIKILLRK